MTSMQERRLRDLAELAGEDLPAKRGPGRPRVRPIMSDGRPKRRYTTQKDRVEAMREELAAIKALTAAKELAAEREIAISKKVAASKPAPVDEEFSTSSRDLYKVDAGVSVQWLAKAFKVTRHTVTKSLVGVLAIGTGDAGNPLYDLRQAAARLVEPDIDIGEYLAKVKPDKLPERLRETYWNARLKEQRWRRSAGDLWDTSQVMIEFSQVLTNVRDKLQLIPDQVERMGGLDVKQWEMVRNLIDQVQDDIYSEILRFSEDDRTFNQLSQEDEVSDEDGDLA